MRHWRIWLFLIGMVGILGLCLYASMPNGIALPRARQPEAVSQTEAPEPAGQTQAAEPQATAITEAPAGEAPEGEAPEGEPTDAPTEAPTDEPVAAAESVDYCVECHSDKDTLIDTAAPVVEVVEESEGAG